MAPRTEMRTTPRLHRRALLLTAAGAGLGLAGLVRPDGARAATDDELAYASFGQATELLLQDFYARVVDVKAFSRPAAREVARAGLNAGEHATQLGKLLTEAGQQAAVADDFEFAWPAETFGSKQAIAKAGLLVTENLAGVYVSALTAVSIPTYRRLYASMLANLSQQVAFLSRAGGGRAIGISFPAAVEIETASGAIEAYLG